MFKGIQPVKRKYPEEYTNTKKSITTPYTKNPYISAIHLEERANLGEMKSFLQFVLIDYKKSLIS